MTSGVANWRRWLGLVSLLALSPAVSFSANPCVSCHPQEVQGYLRSAMSRSLRRPDREPAGSFEHSLSGTKFTVYSNPDGSWQRMQRGGEVSQNRVAYIIGSGSHASGYLVRMGDHLFQSPLCYYTRLKRYDMAPGYEENRAPDFIRAVTEECVLCHSGKPMHIKGTLNEYLSPAFAEESISCDRCHGDPARHLKMPLPGTIVNPVKLAPAARNSVCEQCHLKGAARVLNPGKEFEDFHPGEPLERVFTIYTAALPPNAPREGLKVISQAEQLALSLCARQSNGRMWCGTCHNPHDQSKQPPQYYRARCMACHAGKLTKAHPGGAQGDCVACHMAKQNAKDGGHTVFTDHRISRRPELEHEERESSGNTELVAWREPPAALQMRNFALAYASAGSESGSTWQVMRGYDLLSNVQREFPNDPSVLTALGKALLALKRPLEAAPLFERALKLGPDSAMDESNTGIAFMQAGRLDTAAYHLERAIESDPLLLPAAEALVRVYRQQGNVEKLAALGDRVRQAMGGAAPQESDSTDR